REDCGKSFYLMKNLAMNENPSAEDLESNQVAPNLDPPVDSNAKRPEPCNLFENNPVDLGVLEELSGQNILSAEQFSYSQVVELCKLAAILEKIEIWPYHPLQGKIGLIRKNALLAGDHAIHCPAGTPRETPGPSSALSAC
ncbi:MAG: hypothetical protein EBY45_15025, partial [Gammaproteobacteria bacterium]|nr:hypothetical protein [Gammaproteobacteria bacterium]